MRALTLAPLTLLLLCCSHGSPSRDGRLARATTVDSLVVDSVVYRGRMAVVAEPAGAVLQVYVTARNLRQAAVALESEESGCGPPLTLIAEPGPGRAWSDQAWRAATTPGGIVGCAGTGLGIRLGPGVTEEWPVRQFPVAAVRGDSLPAGIYRGTIGVIIFPRQSAHGRGALPPDTLRVPAGLVRLP